MIRENNRTNLPAPRFPEIDICINEQVISTGKGETLKKIVWCCSAVTKTHKKYKGVYYDVDFMATHRSEIKDQCIYTTIGKLIESFHLWNITKEINPAIHRKSGYPNSNNAEKKFWLLIKSVEDCLLRLKLFYKEIIKTTK